MPRVLLVGGGERARELMPELTSAGFAVRATTAREDELDALRAAGAEPHLGDPDRIATLMPALVAVTVVCWLQADRPEAELNGDRLRFWCEKLVDTPVRGLVYEAAGSAPPEHLAAGREIVRHAHATWLIPLQFIEADPGADRAAWRAAALAAVRAVLAG